MKKWILTGMMAIGGAGMIAAAPPSTAPTTEPTAAAPKIFNQYCPINRDEKVDASVPTVMYDGKVIGFCCKDCPDEFKKDPAKYMKDLK